MTDEIPEEPFVVKVAVSGRGSRGVGGERSGNENGQTLASLAVGMIDSIQTITCGSCTVGC